ADAAKAAIAAAAQGKFWAACDVLFTTDPLDLSHIEELPARLGIDRAQFLHDFDTPETNKRLDQSVDLCRRCHVRAVPTMILVSPKGDAIAVDSPDEAVRIVDDAG
ncbi:MAG: DsbA family protein, partial [Fimbriimonadales bacterium]